MILTLICLEPKYVCLDAGGHANFAEGFSDNVAANLAVVESFLEDIDEIGLVFIEHQRDNIICIFYVADIVFSRSPEGEIIVVAEMMECLACFHDCACIENGEE